MKALVCSPWGLDNRHGLVLIKTTEGIEGGQAGNGMRSTIRFISWELAVCWIWEYGSA